ncbi:hypothetical protein ACFL6C_05495 [Myxococcota bacterium]
MTAMALASGSHYSYDAPMYSSLDRIDIVAKQPDGAQFSVQTDHRSAEPDLSIIF